MRDLTNSSTIKVKGLLFLLMGSLSSILLLFDAPSLRNVLLLCITVWSFCRFYYFAFYVIERYVDPSYRFWGLYSFACYMFRKRKQP